jgi:aerobic-type carbon monoxide dehydrogenase small subunit (CoxS/CutS family)
MQLMTLKVNGETVHVACPGHETLLETLRERLDLTGTKHGCELGECGACAVLVDGQPVLSCLVLTAAAQGHEVLTIEGVGQPGGLHPLQTSLAESGAAQCGYCMPGIVVTAQALLERNPNPSRLEIREALAGNLCRCTGYVQIVDAVEQAAARLREANPA